MVKGAKKKAVRAKKPTVPRVTRSNYFLDGAAVDHIKLMADPCQGRLVPPAYPTPGGGALLRVRAVVQVGAAAGETAGFFHWMPGINEYYSNGAATGTTAYTPSNGTAFPGLSFAAGAGNSATTYRTVAACCRVITNTSEMNRAGVIYAGQTPGNYYGTNSGSSTNVQTAVSGLPVSARMPAKHLEVLWVPTERDFDFNTDDSGNATVLGAQSYGAVSVGFVGAPQGTGVTVELIAVYEVQYNANGNIVAFPAPPSNTPFNQVLRGFYDMIGNAPVIIDTARKGLEYLGGVLSSQPGRAALAGAARLALTM